MEGPIPETIEIKFQDGEIGLKFKGLKLEAMFGSGDA